MERQNSGRMRRPGTFLLITLFGFAAGIISLLSEPVNELKVYALQQLNAIVDQFWPEISEAIEKM